MVRYQSRCDSPSTASPGDGACPRTVGLGLVKAEGTHKERSKTRIALALERYHTAAHGDVDRTPMMRWSDSSPLVNDLMAAGIRLCSYMIGVDPERSQTLIVPLRSMHHACSDWRSQTFCADSLTGLHIGPLTVA